MGKRIIIKTILICTGIFLILNAIILAYIFKTYPLDLEKYVPAVVAAVDIESGTILEPRHVRERLIKESALNSAMETELDSVLGKKTVGRISSNDYLRGSDLVDKKSWYAKDERIIILPVSMEERLANLIRKGSLIDIRLKKESGGVIETVLNKIIVVDMLDENGNSIDSKVGMNSRIAYMELILNEEKRHKVYASLAEGKLIYELYCNEDKE